MLPSDKFYLPREEMQKLTKGSFEHLSAKVEAAVKAEKARLFENSDAQVLGTYPTHLVVLTDSGKVFSVKYEENIEGAIRLMSATPMDATIYPRAAMPTFLRKEAKAVADLFRKGMVAEGNRRLSMLTKLVNDDTPFDESKVVENFAARFTKDRTWHKVVEARTGEVKQALGESFERIAANKLRAKFFKLYDGSLSEAELENYRGLVVEDLGLLVKRVEAVRAQMTESVSKLREVVEKVPAQHQETLAAFESFVKDFADDLANLPRELDETMQGIDSVGARGELFDTVAEELLRYEVAGAFAVQMTNKLVSAS